MSQAKSRAKKASPKSKGEAARAEKAKEAVTVEFRGLTLTVPTKVPGTLLWDFNDMMSGDERSLGSFAGLLSSLIGFDQSRQVRSKVEAEGLDMDETIEAVQELIGQVFETSGQSLGE